MKEWFLIGFVLFGVILRYLIDGVVRAQGYGTVTAILISFSASLIICVALLRLWRFNWSRRNDR